MSQPDLNAYLSASSFWLPDRIVNSAWLQHGPFAFWLIESLRPRTLVELGTHHGFSYLAFCQAVRRLALPTKCFAVDMWQGDEHAGKYSESVYDDLKSYHDPRFSDFSRMVRLRFDEAAKHFADGSVDLLHVDGRHFYEDAKEDYETWLPKLSNRAVVLFHDTNVRERNFGVWRLWQELSAEHPGFEFVHGHGLGVLGVGKDLPQPIRDLFKAAADQGPAIRETYFRLGSSVQDRFALQSAAPAQPKPQIPAKPPAAPAIISKPGASLHIHLAAMAPRLLDVRTYLPLRELAKNPDVSTTSSDLKIEFPKLPPDQPKVIILQRLAVMDQEGWIKGLAHLEAKGWVSIVEADDHPDLTNRVSRKESDELTWSPVRLCHAVQTSTDMLANAFRQHNPEVAVFRNATFKPIVAKRARSVAGLRVFFGALNREAFSSQVGAALAPFATAHPQVEFIVVHDRAFFDALEPCNKTFHPTTASYDEYIALMAGCDICLMPLGGNSGETYKSDLKFVEASSLGLASIASPPVYGATIQDGTTGLIAENLADWPRQLDYLVRNPDALTKIGRAAQDYVRRERQFSLQIGDRLAWYRDLWSRREALSQALRQRIATPSAVVMTAAAQDG
jgi:glycosyltransferase involved in cell wall biosynthesis